jgi:thiol-disulfide isomerase/thioredoxin
MRFRLFFTLLLAGMCILLHAEEDQTEGIVFLKNEPWASVLQKAKEQDRLIFMDCYTAWCGPCKALAKDIFPQKKVGDYFNASFINVAYDMEKGEGKLLYEKYRKNIIGFPTLLLINDREEIVHQMAGYKEADVLLEGVKAGAGGYSLFASEKKYGDGARDMATVSAYLNALEQAHLTEKIRPVADEYLKTVTVDSLATPDVWALIGKHVTDPYSEAYRFVFDNIERKFQYGLKVNRYDLEKQLTRHMSEAVGDILKTAKATRDADTLKLIREQSEYLSRMLAQNTVKGFPTLAAKLQINTLRLDGKPLEVYRTVACLEPSGLLASESTFKADAWRYVAENVTDSDILQAIAEKVTALQAGQKSPDNALSYNFYDVLALTWARLGDKAKSKEAQAEYDKRREARDAYFKELLAKRKSGEDS